MKKIMIVSPFYNGLYKYTKPLYEELCNKNSKEYEFKHIGNPNMTFDLKEIENTVEKLADEIISFNPDIIHYNYGTYDIEQLVPYYLEKKDFKCKQILTYHSLQLDIFKKINNPEYDKIVNDYMGKMDGYIFFTEYAKNIFIDKYGVKPNYRIAFHPATHLDIHLDKEKAEEFDVEFGINRDKPIATLLGYPSHWKDTKPVIKLVENFKNVNFVIAGPWWKDKILKENENIELTKLENLKIIDKELNVDEFNYALDLGIGLFPYHYFKSFQGSGLLPNYLYRGINTVVNDIAPLKEYYDKAIDMCDTGTLFKKFNEAINNPHIKKDNRFSYVEHAKKMIEIYREV